MPYIHEGMRVQIDRGRAPATAGELNYAITVLVRDYFRRQGRRYQQINDVLGALEGAKLEFYRRVASDYEDTKILKNGDVY